MGITSLSTDFYIMRLILYNWLNWRVLKLAFSFQKNNFPVFILASATVRKRHLYVDIGTNDRRHFAFGTWQEFLQKWTDKYANYNTIPW